MEIRDAIYFLENELDIDSDRSSFKEYSKQKDKVYEIIKLLKNINTILNCRAYDQEHT